MIDQAYLTSWNNKQAPGYGDRATGQQFSSVYRSQLLDNNLNDYLQRDSHKLTLADVINAMGIAGTQDLRGVEVLPYALKIIGTPRNPTLAQAVSELQAWVASGAHRINRENPGASGNYDQSDAIRIMDAWWPLLVKADFTPVLGPTCSPGRVRLRDQRPAWPSRHQRRPSGLLVGRRLLRDRAEGPARGPAPARRAASTAPTAARLAAAAGPRWRLAGRAAAETPIRSTRPTASARPATRCARTRSSSGPSARSPSR